MFSPSPKQGSGFLAAAALLVLLLGAPLRAQSEPEPSESGSTTDENAELERLKLSLEIQRLELEIKKLERERERKWWQKWAIPGVVVGLLTALATLIVAWRARIGALDQAVHEKRLELYPDLIAATSSMALYFSWPAGSAKVKLTSADCERVGRKMSRWYFEGGGLLLSNKTRQAYFSLARCLTFAAEVDEELAVPVFPKDAPRVSAEKMKRYAAKLPKLETDLDRIGDWKFGRLKTRKERDAFLKRAGWVSRRIATVLQWFEPRRKPDKDEKERATKESALDFKDFVYLQRLSSRLRTSLAEDLRGRRRPARGSGG